MPPQHPSTDRDATQVIDAVPGFLDIDPDGPTPRGHRRRGKGKTLLIVLAVFVLLAGSGFIAAGLYANSVNSDVERVDAFQDVPEAQRPKVAAAAKGAINYLMLGSDSRDPNTPGGSRSDTIILLHVNKDKSKASLTSINRDTWVFVPPSKDGRNGNTKAKINAAYAWGGIPLMVQTVEKYTDVRIDHVIMVDFSGFKEIVDALDGVEITVEQAFTSKHALTSNSIRRFEAGEQTMNGAKALDYARERHAFKDGDFTRVRHQQQVIKAVLNKAASGGLLANPVKLNSFLRATADAVGVDEKLNIFDTAKKLRHLRSDNLTFFTSPNSGTGMEGTQSVVKPDVERAKKFYEAIKNDDLTTAEKYGQK